MDPSPSSNGADPPPSSDIASHPRAPALFQCPSLAFLCPRPPVLSYSLQMSFSSIWVRQGGWGTVASAGEGLYRTRRRAQWSRNFPRRRRGLEKTVNWYCRSITRLIPTVHQGVPSRF
uniref:Predicted protein n=1 Tax=Hordeum vulgare subsp. vulgare TaxID=112509 RepID=F2D5G8_HORVV|nr:predicted protein [Hordeum vulgare subsp. vulgare]